MIDVEMPQMGESIVEGTLTKWLKKPGDKVERDEPLFEISTDKVDTEIPSPAAGTLAETLVDEGKTVAINTVVARINESDGDRPADTSPAATAGPERAEPDSALPQVPKEAANPTPPASSTQTAPPPAAGPYPPTPGPAPALPPEEPQGPLSPIVRKMAREFNIDLRQVKGTGAGGRITKQ